MVKLKKSINFNLIIMRQKRRKFSPEFKAKVALEAIKEQMTTSEIAKKYSVSPNQVSTWKREFIENAAQAFSGNNQQEVEKVKESLYAKIGKLEVERDFLKKSLWKTGL
ncbi:MAG: transposase [Weeksellaceae bacterium]